MTPTSLASPLAELIVTEPVKGFSTKDGKVKVVGTSDAETVRVSFEWRGNLDDAKTPPKYVDLPVEDGVFRGTFQLPKGRWITYVAASIDGGYPAVAEINVRSLNDKMAVRVEAIDGKTRVRLTKPNGDVIAEKILLQDGEKKVFRVDPDVILRVGNAKAANVTRRRPELRGHGQGRATGRVAHPAGQAAQDARLSYGAGWTSHRWLHASRSSRSSEVSAWARPSPVPVGSSATA